VTTLSLAELERQNIDLVTRFCAAWSERRVEALLPFVADDVFYQMWDAEDAIVVQGKPQLIETLGPFLESTRRVEFEIVRTQGMGKIVTNERHDTFVFDGDTEWFFPVVGVFVLEDGLIRHWKDFVTPTKPVRM
jgi:limonene-1,2-epoxide hydrolase